MKSLSITRHAGRSQRYARAARGSAARVSSIRLHGRRLAAVALLLLAGFGSLKATTFTVTNRNDAGAGSLRQAIINANADGSATPGSPHIIDLSALKDTITLLSALPAITNHITFNGPAVDILTIDGNTSFRIFSIAPGKTVSVNNLTLQQALADSGGAVRNQGTLTMSQVGIAKSVASLIGGAVFNGGSLILNGGLFSRNSAGDKGGGVYNAGSLTATNTTLFGDTAVNQGGGLYNINPSTANLVNCTVTRNVASSGGGCTNAAAATLNALNTIFCDNTALTGTDFSGVLSSQGYNFLGKSTGATIGGVLTGNILDTFAGLGPLARNGGQLATCIPASGSPVIDAGTTAGAPAADARGYARPKDGNCSGTAEQDMGAVEFQSFLVSSTADAGAGSLRQAVLDANALSGPDGICFASGLVGDTIKLAGGQIAISDNLTILGPGADSLAVSGLNGARLFLIDSSTSATIARLRLVQGNAGAGAGGAIFAAYGASAALANCVVSNCSAGGAGGGIFADSGFVTISRTFIGGCASADSGGGVFLKRGFLSLISSTLDHNSAAGGGGVYSSKGNLFLSRSTVSANVSTGTGGGIASMTGTLTLFNSTVSANRSIGSGGGIYNGTALGTFINATVTADTSAGASAGGIKNAAGLLKYRNTLIAGNQALINPDYEGDLNSLGYNLLGNTTGAAIKDTVIGNILNVNPLLGPLTNNGGPTLTHALLAGRPAIEAGTNYGADLTGDQRGYPRLRDADCDGIGRIDIGAYEYATQYAVADTSSSGPGSLSQKILDADASADPSAICIDMTGITGIIKLAAPLPLITHDLIINGPTTGTLIVSGENGSQILSVASGKMLMAQDLQFSNGKAPGGGALLIQAGGSVKANNCTFSNSSATTGGGGIQNAGSLTLTNCTVSGCSSAGIGGGIQNSGTISMNSCTIAQNSAATQGGGVINTGTFASVNSICAGNTAPQGPDFYGTMNSQGWNNVGNGANLTISGVTTGNQINVNPLIGALAKNGGGSYTHALLPGSPLLDAGSVANAPSMDQRGVSRVGLPDIGAFESRRFKIVAKKGTPQVTLIGTAFANPLVDSLSSAFGEPVAGGIVTFVPPSSGASCTFSGGAGATVATDGKATSNPLTANSVGGNYLVLSTSAGSDTAAFSLKNNQPPVAICKNVTKSTGANCNATATGAEFDNGSYDPNGDPLTFSLAPAGPYAIGTTSVTLTVSDPYGASSTCGATITVQELTPPTIVCPANITAVTAPNSCSAVVSWPTPPVSDNCPGVGSPTCTPASGSTFSKGSTGVTCIVTDASGNTAACSFTVTVNDAQAPAITTPANITRSTDPGQCTAVVSYALPLATDNCPGLGSVICVPAPGSTFSKGATSVNCSVTDASGNNSSCSFTVTINDTQPPSIVCPANITMGGNPCAVVSFTPTVGDNCPGVTTACVPPSGTCVPAGTTAVTCTATDQSSNTASCSFSVTVVPCTIACSSNIVHATDPGQCGAVVTYTPPATSGQCGAVTCTPSSGAFFPKGVTTVTCVTAVGPTCSFTVTVNDTQPPLLVCPANMNVGTDPGQCFALVNYSVTASDNCPGLPPPACSPPSGSIFQKGVTTVGCSVTDAAGNSANCSFLVTVTDTQFPAIVCSGNIIAGTDPNQCGAMVTYPSPVTTDNCPGLGSATCAPVSGSFFPKGATTVTCSVTDGSGNTSSCSFLVTVNDTQSPSLSVPSGITVGTDPGACYATVTWSIAATDNCPGVVSSCTPPSGSVFVRGAKSVNCSATDAAGNTSNASFLVTVNDNEPPVITCPPNVILEADMNCTGKYVTYGSPTITDNCLGAYLFSAVPASGSFFDIGTTPVTLVAKDSGGNTAACGFNVTVVTGMQIGVPGSPVYFSYGCGSSTSYTKTLKIANLGGHYQGGVMIWKATTSSPEIYMPQTTGVEGQSLTVTLSPGSLPVGTYTRSIKIDAWNSVTNSYACNSPVIISVKIIVQPTGTVTQTKSVSTGGFTQFTNYLGQVVAEVKSNSGTLPNFTLSMIPCTYPPNAGSYRYIKRYFNITSYASAPNVDLRLYYTNSEMGTITKPGAITLYHYAGSSWINAGGTSDTLTNAVTATGITSVDGTWALAHPLVPKHLSIRILAASYDPVSSRSTLQWRSEFPPGAEGFVVERATQSGLASDAWDNVGNIPVAPSSEYGYSEPLASGERYFYRITTTDSNGDEYASDVAEVDARPIPAELTLAQNYPNPFSGSTKISYALPRNTRVTLTVYDIYMREVRRIVDTEESAGVHTLTVSTDDLPSGTYLYRIEAGGRSIIRKMNLTK